MLYAAPHANCGVTARTGPVHYLEGRHGAKELALIRHSIERLERRLQGLEDGEAIRNLKARYAARCDQQYDADGTAALFTEYVLWESPGLGRFNGREASRSFFWGASEIFSFAIDYSLNGQIEVHCDTAPPGPVHAVHGGVWKPSAVVRQHRSRNLRPG